MHFLNSPENVIAFANPSDPSFKDTIINYAQTLDLHSLYSLSGKYGSDIFRATISDDSKGNKAVLEAVKKEIDALIEERRTEEANMPLEESPIESEEEGSTPEGQSPIESEEGEEGTQDVKVTNESPSKKDKDREGKNESPRKKGTRRSMRLMKKNEGDEHEHEHEHEESIGEASGSNKTLVLRHPRTPKG